MTDRLLAIAAFAGLVVFLGILVWFVPRLDLGALVLVTLALVGWDFFVPAGRSRRR